MGSGSLPFSRKVIMIHSGGRMTNGGSAQWVICGLLNEVKAEHSHLLHLEHFPPSDRLIEV
jgi:hypothetical protein